MKLKLLKLNRAIIVSSIVLQFVSPCITYAQYQNAIYFDGANDLISAPAASALVANPNTKLSLSLWVKPLSLKGGTNTYHGFAGLRNESNCDFYILQLTDNTIEARFRNSANKFFTIKYPNMKLNIWQHFVLTYDGSYIKFYANGALSDSLSANGDITNKTIDFKIGHIIFNSTTWHLKGSLDEVALWSKALTANEVKCIYKSLIDKDAPGLELYYDFNQGVASKNNKSILKLIDKKGKIDGNIKNIALIDTVSNFVRGIVNYSPTFASICPGDNYLFQGTNVNVLGFYSKRFSSSRDKCDSIVGLELDTKGIDIGVSQKATALHANQDSATYQWVNCNPYSTISGATNQDYIPSSFGDYAVIVKVKGCIDTSACMSSAIVGIHSTVDNSKFSIYPNPAQKDIEVILPNNFIAASIIITDIKGNCVLFLNKLSQGQNKIDISNFSKGLYFVKLTNDVKYSYQKLIVE